MHTASTCNGTGTCNAGTTTSCGAYQCDAAGAACADDVYGRRQLQCRVLQRHRVRRFGDGQPRGQRRRRKRDVRTAPWTTNGGTLTIQTGIAHGGTYSASATGRTANYNGPAYPMPTGAGSYTISAWAMQNENATQNVALQVNLSCGEPAAGGMFPTIGQYGIACRRRVRGRRSAAPWTWGPTPACQPDAATPGVVRSAMLYLNQTAAGTTAPFPNLFLDDVVIRPAAAGQNLVGNPNFEAGTTVGWEADRRLAERSARPSSSRACAACR